MIVVYHELIQQMASRQETDGDENDINMDDFAWYSSY